MKAYFALILFILFAVNPFYPVLGQNYFDHQRTSQVLLLTFCVLAVCGFDAWKWNANFPGRLRLISGLVLFYGFGLLGVLVADSKLNSFLEFLHWLFLGLMFVVFAYSAKDEYISAASKVFLVVHGFLIFRSFLFLSYAVIEGDQLAAAVIYPKFENIRFFNQIQLFVLPVLLILLRYRRCQFIAASFLFANVLLLLIGGARGALLALVITFVMFAIIAPVLRIAIVRAVFVSMGAFAFYGVLVMTSNGGELDLIRTGSSGRLELWLEILLSRDVVQFVSGIGPGGYPNFSVSGLGHPHNFALQIFLEWGLGALIGLLAVLWVMGERAYDYLKSNPEDVFAWGAAFGGALALVYSMVDGVMVMPVPQTFTLIFLAVLWGRAGVRSNLGRERDAFLLSNKAIKLALLILLLIYAFLVFIYYDQQGALQDIKGPRFWLNGALLR